MKIISLEGIASYNFTNKVIRQKKDIINLLLECCKCLIMYKAKIHDKKVSDSSCFNNGDISIVIFIDKMSRLFFCTENKIQSFRFPFDLNLEKSDSEMLSYNGHSVTLESIFIMTSIFKEQIDNIDTIMDRLFNNEVYCANSQNDRDYLNKMLYNLIIFEDGYLRFDFNDKANEREIYHPLHHIDLFYSNATTFKIGLFDMLKISECINVLDINTECYYIQTIKN